MKKYKLEKTKLIAMGLIAPIAIFIYAALEAHNSKKDSDQSQSSISEIINQEQNDISNHYIVRINGNIYLTTRSLSKDRNNNIFKYYDVKTNEMVGQVLRADYFARAQDEFNKDIQDKKTVNVEGILNDILYFDGEYGYGKNIPITSVFPLTDYVQSDILSSDAKEFFSGNSDALKNFLDNNQIYYDLGIVNEVTYIYNYDKSNNLYNHSSENKINYLKLQKFTLINENKTYIGYRCSCNEKDKGYNYVYDLSTQNIYYIDNNDSMLVEDYTGGKTVSEIKNELNSSLVKEAALVLSRRNK